MAQFKIDVRGAFDASVVVAELATTEDQVVRELKTKIEERIGFPAAWQTLLAEGSVVPLRDACTVGEALGGARSVLLIQQRPRDPDAEWQQAWEGCDWYSPDTVPSEAYIRHLLPHVRDPNVAIATHGFEAARLALLSGASAEVLRAFGEDPRVDVNGSFCSSWCPCCGRREEEELREEGSLLEVAMREDRSDAWLTLAGSRRLSKASCRSAMRSCLRFHNDPNFPHFSMEGPLDVYQKLLDLLMEVEGSPLEHRSQEVQRAARDEHRLSARRKMRDGLAPAAYDDWDDGAEDWGARGEQTRRKQTRRTRAADGHRIGAVLELRLSRKRLARGATNARKLARRVKQSEGLA